MTSTWQIKPVDWWGYVWSRAYNMNTVVYTTGTMGPGGGWYRANLWCRCARTSTGCPSAVFR